MLERQIDRLRQGELPGGGKRRRRGQGERQQNSHDGRGRGIAGTRFHQHEQHGNHNQGKEHRRDQTHGDHACQRTPQTRAGNDHGRHSHRGSHRGEEDRAQPALAGFDGGALERVPIPQLFVDVIHQDDGIPNDDSAERDHPGERRETERIAGDQKAQHGAEQRQRNRTHDNQRFGEIAKLHQQHQKDGDQADSQRFGHHRQSFAAVGNFAPVLDTVAVREREGFHWRADGVQNLRSIVAAPRKRADRQGANAIAAHDAAGLPLRRELGDGAQRDAGVCNRGGHVSVADVLKRIPAPGIEAQQDGHGAVAFPKGADRKPAEPPGQEARNRGVRQSQPIGDFRVDVDVHQVGVAEIIVVNELSVGDAAQYLLHALSDLLQFGDVVSGDAHLDGSLHGHALL